MPTSRRTAAFMLVSLLFEGRLAFRSGRTEGLFEQMFGAHCDLKLGILLISLVPMNSVFKALAHPARRQIIVMLRERPMPSGEIAAAFDMSWPTVTGHLTALKDAGLVEAERDGNSIRYRLQISAIEEAVAVLMDLVDAVPKTDPLRKLSHE
ncbi:transcriptional regulator, ArsR family [Caulobacter vibrioides CB15]|uniref:Transcriptional regulator, ArsR family n=2 Tax=Caulobacter vibrioides TaxID=155892 RepID=Q9A415_CAUVC|nr:transcriptional regulator, ArsR family [Caulobacter vibrioides CB15]